MTRQEKQEYILHIQGLYNEWLEKTENRNISYGELAYIQNLSMKDLRGMEEELYTELAEEDE